MIDMHKMQFFIIKNWVARLEKSIDSMIYLIYQTKEKVVPKDKLIASLVGQIISFQSVIVNKVCDNNAYIQLHKYQS